MSVRDNQMINQNTDDEAQKISALIGTTKNTGGSATAGTLMGKLNAIISKVNGSGTMKVSCVKSIQTIEATIPEDETTLNVTISAVDVNKTVINHLGSIENAYSSNAYEDDGLSAVWDTKITLKNSTTVELDRAVYSTESVLVSFQVVEFY